MIRMGQMQLYYQMQVDDSGRIIGAEALIRWLHPVRGLVPPGLFIPFAEHTGYIKMLTRWVQFGAVSGVISKVKPSRSFLMTVKPIVLRTSASFGLPISSAIVSRYVRMTWLSIDSRPARARPPSGSPGCRPPDRTGCCRGPARRAGPWHP